MPVTRRSRKEAAEITALTPAQPPPPPRYGTIGRRDRERLGDVIAIADATQVHFEFAGFRVRREYHRELWSLASAILDTDDGAVSLRSYAAHGLPADDREEVGKRRALSVAAMLQQMGVEWQRIRIEDEVGVSDPDARPSWRDHRVEFSAIRTLPPGDSTSEELAASGGATGVELDATVAGSDDPLATLVADTIIYFGGNSAKVSPQRQEEAQTHRRVRTEGRRSPHHRGHRRHRPLGECRIQPHPWSPPPGGGAQLAPRRRRPDRTRRRGRDPNHPRRRERTELEAAQGGVGAAVARRPARDGGGRPCERQL